MLSITLFGAARFELQTRERTQALLLSPRCAELLAFLGVYRGQTFLRGDLAESIWGEQASDTAFNNINTALWRVRKVLEAEGARPADYLTTDRRRIGLHGGGSVQVDVAEFECQARSGLKKPIDQMDDSDCNALRDSIQPYRDRPLADFSNVWALKSREMLRSIFLDALARLMECHAAKTRYNEAIGYARKMLDIDPVREDVHFTLMRYFAFNGQRTLALRQFEICRSLLQRELSVSPLPETIALYREIANNSLTSGAAVSSAGVARHPPESTALEQLRQGVARVNAKSTSPIPELRILRGLLAELDDHLRTIEARFGS